MHPIIRGALAALAISLAAPLAVVVSLHAPPAQAQAALIDINSATEAQLDALKGIGPVRAAAIIKGRPYKRKDELVTRNIIPQSVYDGIKDQIIAKQ
jgi:competence protein ComEA